MSDCGGRGLYSEIQCTMANGHMGTITSPQRHWRALKIKLGRGPAENS